MRLRFFGGLAIDGPDGGSFVVRGRGQEALLLRLAIDTGTTVAYRALTEDVWPDDPPANPRASLQSLASRLRRALPDAALEAMPGGYRLAISRDDVDVARFQDLVASARRSTDPDDAAAAARAALDLWTGAPWTPGDGFDWLVRDLLEDRAHAERILKDAAARGVAVGAAAGPGAPASEIPGRAPTDADAPVSVVPAALTALVGRGRELDLIAAQVEAERLVTLIGPGGAGKTTLALETARRRPGAVVVELAPASSGEVWTAIAGAVARSVRITDTTITAPGARERAIEVLAGRRLLLVLDNCEHVSREAADVALQLLGAVPDARILATSREPLGIPGEAFVDLGPLPDADAVELFTRRVRAARGAAPREEESDAVARIVRRLDGLPLALELAAAKTRTLSIEEIDAGLDDRFALLAAGPRAADPRHQTLRALIDWSWETLTDTERTALLAAAVFPDGVDAADVPTIGRTFGVDAAAFDQLVDRSLLRRAEGRFRMLETVREYGVDRLRATGDEGEFRSREAQAMAALSGPRDEALHGEGVRTALAWFDANDENVSAALRTAAELPALRETGVRLVRASLWRWMMRERFDDLSRALESFAHSGLDTEPAVVVDAVALIATLFTAVDPYSVVDPTGAGAGSEPLPHSGASRDDGMPDPVAAARALADRARPIVATAHAHGTPLSVALSGLLDGAVRAADAYDTGAAWPALLEIVVPTGDVPPWSTAFLSMMRAALAQNSGDVETLGRESERSLALFRELGDMWGIAFASQMRSEWLLLQGRLEEALDVADASTEGLDGLTAPSDIIQQRMTSISALTRLGRFDEARARLAEIEETALADGSDRVRMITVLAASTLALAEGDGDAALAALEGLSLIPEGGPPQMRAWAATHHAQANLLAGRVDEARDALRIALPDAVRSGDQPIISDTVLTVAAWLADTGQDAAARRALAASLRLRGTADETNPALVRLRRRLGGAAAEPAEPAEVSELIELLG
ncbi:NB-ARC domain-containing protein [Microbacterium ulmi]|uniref:ATPase n=1 Tax=Microbacterium ulmi TaxID=179095 RepID=A0A7Y2M252_9MICO|nr:putative ATPase [Microbacterium ulmi]NNH03693.1 ATPase [Microbacterium ulmi]